MEREFSTGELTDSELQRKLSGHRRDMAKAEPGSARWRELELKIAECMTERFSSGVCLADLQYVDGLGELPGAPGAAAELAEDPPGLELGVRAFAG